MVERSDRAPLLEWEEVPCVEKPSRVAPPAAHAKDRVSSPSNNRAALGCSTPVFGWSSVPGGPVSSQNACSATPATSSNPASKDEALLPDSEEHRADAGAREASPEDRLVKSEEKDQIVSVFVVTFNTRTGADIKYATRNYNATQNMYVPGNR